MLKYIRKIVSISIHIAHRYIHLFVHFVDEKTETQRIIIIMTANIS